MKKRILFILLVLATIKAFTQSETNSLNVLFVGNSITYFNDLPQTFMSIAEEQGYNINLDQHTPGGTGFVNHVNNNTLYDKLDSTVWDYVILQPGSNESPGFSYPIEQTIARAIVLRDKILENSPCASIYFYEISYGIVDNSAASLQQYLDRQVLIKNNLIQMSNETNIPLAPVGETFQTSIQQDESHFLWGGYGDIHPNAKGSFMGACTFYNAIFQKPIVNSTVNATLSQNDANYFRGIAESVTLNNLDDWNIDTLVAHASYTYSSSDGITVNFTNTSTNFDTISWNFGDGTTSTDSNPSHQFDFNIQNSYKVYLTAVLDCKEHHFVQTIMASNLGYEEPRLKFRLKIFPNPVKNNFTISTQLELSYTYKLIDILGNEVKSGKVHGEENYELDISNYESGFYFLVIETKNRKSSIKIIKK